MKKFKDTKVGGFFSRLSKSKGVKVLASVLKGGVMDLSMPAVGLVSGAIAGLSEGVKQVKKGNFNDEVGGVGKPNYIRWAAMGIGVILLLYFFGIISEEQVNFVFALFE